MALLVTPDRGIDAQFFVFDLEVVGPSDDPTRCHIYDLAIVHMVTRTCFHAVVDPQLETYTAPPHKDLFHVTQQYLDDHHAQPFAQVGPRVTAFVASFLRPGQVVAMVSHGTFLLDKPVLEEEYRRLGTQVPPCWFFYDTLPFMRRRYRGQASYSLKNLYQKVFWAPIIGHHSAAADVAALHMLLLHATGGNLHKLTGCYCPAYLRPLQTVRFIGSQKEQLLFAAGISSVEDLIVTLAKTCTLDTTRMAAFLQQTCSIERTSALKISRSLLNVLLLGR